MTENLIRGGIYPDVEEKMEERSIWRNVVKFHSFSEIWLRAKGGIGKISIDIWLEGEGEEKALGALVYIFH